MFIKKYNMPEVNRRGVFATQTAQDTYRSVLDSTGAILSKRDVFDTRIAQYKSTDISHSPTIIDSQNNLGGFPQYNAAGRNQFTLNKSHTNPEVCLNSGGNIKE